MISHCVARSPISERHVRLTDEYTRRRAPPNSHSTLPISELRCLNATAFRHLKIRYHDGAAAFGDGTGWVTDHGLLGRRTLGAETFLTFDSRPPSTPSESAIQVLTLVAADRTAPIRELDRWHCFARWGSYNPKFQVSHRQHLDSAEASSASGLRTNLHRVSCQDVDSTARHCGVGDFCTCDAVTNPFIHLRSPVLY